MIQYGYTCLRRFPKSEKFTLVAETKCCMYDVLRLNITANKRYYKKTTIRDMDVEMEVLKHMVRMAHDLKFLPHSQYKKWQGMNIEIGCMLGGWMKTTHAP